MPMFQNPSGAVNANLTIGNYKIETAAWATATSILSTWVNLGAGIVNSFGHNITKYNVQAGNAPDPIEGISGETFTIAAELIEFDASVLTLISGGAMTGASSGTYYTINGGGNAVLTPRAYKLTNTRLVGAATKTTVILVYKATLDTGIQFTAKSDNDADPINVMPITITGKQDLNQATGSQLFLIQKQM